MIKITLKRILLVIIWLMMLQVAGYPAAARGNPFELKVIPAFDLSILGPPLASEEACAAYLRKRGQPALLTVSVEQLVHYFYQEGQLEGIRPDVMFAQAIHETGHFRYGGDVVPLQNNYCGLGTTGGGVKGAWFPTAQMGVRAQVQHLLVYASTKLPEQAIVDPRYDLVKRSANFGQARTWTDLNGKWAVPGKNYGQMILRIHQRILMGE